MKNISVPVAVAIAIVGCVLAVRASVSMGKIDDNLKAEQYRRIKAEQNLQIAENSIGQLKAQLAETSGKLQTIEQVLNQGRTRASSLEVQLKEVAHEKSQLATQIEQMQKALTAAQQQLQKTAEPAGAPAGQ